MIDLSAFYILKNDAPFPRLTTLLSVLFQKFLRLPRNLFSNDILQALILPLQSVDLLLEGLEEEFFTEAGALGVLAVALAALSLLSVG